MWSKFSKFRGGKLALDLLLAALFVFSAGPAPAQYISVTDNTCTAGQECAGISGQGCNSTTFNLTTARQVHWCASIKCTSTNCVHCLSVAYIYGASSDMRDCIYNDCEGNCPESCESSVELPAGTYTLYSCKLDCLNDDCSQCTNDCVAEAKVDMFP